MNEREEPAGQPGAINRAESIQDPEFFEEGKEEGGITLEPKKITDSNHDNKSDNNNDDWDL